MADQSRVEQILRSKIDKTPYTGVPQSRVEALLMQINPCDCENPFPVINEMKGNISDLQTDMQTVGSEIVDLKDAQQDLTTEVNTLKTNTDQTISDLQTDMQSIGDGLISARDYTNDNLENIETHALLDEDYSSHIQQPVSSNKE